MNDAQCMVDGISEGMGERGHKMNMAIDVYYLKTTLEYKPHWSISHTGV